MRESCAKKESMKPYCVLMRTSRRWKAEFVTLNRNVLRGKVHAKWNWKWLDRRSLRRSLWINKSHSCTKGTLSKSGYVKKYTDWLVSWKRTSFWKRRRSTPSVKMWRNPRRSKWLTLLNPSTRTRSTCSRTASRMRGSNARLPSKLKQRPWVAWSKSWTTRRDLKSKST